MIDLRRKLTHLAQLETRISTSGGGLFPDQMDITQVYTINCFCYYESGERRDEMNTTITGVGRWTVILPRSFWDVVYEGCSIRNIVDRFGVQILDIGRIEQKVVYHHFRNGPSFVQVVLHPNISE